jgi:mannose-6-phosphate isomerase
VQQSSDLTFRLYDWGRVGSDGKPRPLHVEQALACIDFNRGPIQPVAPVPVVDKNHRAEELVRCEHFVIRRHAADCFPLPQDGRFRIMISVAGKTQICCGGDALEITMGGTVLVPARCAPTDVIVEQDAAVLEAFAP